MSGDRSLRIAPATFDDYRRLAECRLPRAFFDYLDGGSHDEITLAANREALRAIRFRQQVMRDVSAVDTRTVLFGRELAMPLVLAPIGLAGLYATRGEVQGARSAEAAGIPFCLSTVGICGLEEVGAGVTAPFWFQLYMLKDRGYVAELLARARAAGCSTLVFTVDLAVTSARYRDVRNGMAGSSGGGLRKAWDILSHPRWVRDVAIRGKPLVFGNLAAYVPDARRLPDFRAWVDSQFDASVTWKDIEWVRAQWPGDLVIKGVMEAADARAAADCGAQAVVVSNHGGRQLDSAPATLEVLPEIAAAVGDRVDLIVDGGICGGQDIAKALARGARAAMMGRGWIFPLAAQGGAGLDAALAAMKRELEITMALTGCRTVAQLTPDILRPPADCRR